MKNRRHSARFAVREVEGTLTSATHVQVINMSLSGIAIQLERPLNIGRQYVLHIEKKYSQIELVVEVVWCSLSGTRKSPQGDAPVYSAGLRFTDAMSPRQRELLEFLEEHRPQGEKRLGGARFKIEAPGAVILDVPQQYEVKLISLSGALIGIDRRLELDEIHPMEIALPDGVKIRFSARVASCFEVLSDKGAAYEIGIAFVKMQAEPKARLKDFLKSLED
jgi:hypothetical protein